MNKLLGGICIALVLAFLAEGWYLGNIQGELFDAKRQIADLQQQLETRDNELLTRDKELLSIKGQLEEARQAAEEARQAVEETKKRCLSQLLQATHPEVLIAVLDTGIDQQHEDLAGKVVASVNFSDSPTVSDFYGHGTFVAGIIATNAKCRLLNVKVADDNGVVLGPSVAKGIVWAVDNGAKVINMSLIVPTPSSALEQAVDYAWSKGVVLVAGAGNTKSIVYPAFYPEVIAVAATDSEGELWPMSNSGDWVDAYAPGVEIFSTLPGNNYGYWSGTSMAAAYISAAAASALTTVTDADGDGFVNDEVADLLTTLFALKGGG